MKLDAAALFRDILEFDPDRKRANHLLKVAGYAAMIGRGERLEAEDLFWLDVAALLHDIGIKPSLEKYGSDAGEHQQVEGPPIATAMLARYGCPAARVERVCWLIAHHHVYAGIADRDHRVLVEADFLVNCDEGGMDRERVLAVRRDNFRTAAGTFILDRIFGLPA